MAVYHSIAGRLEMPRRISYRDSPGKHLNGKEIGICQDGEVGADEASLPVVVVWLRFGAPE